MDVILPEADVTTDSLTRILEEGAVSFRIDDDGDIYVNEFASPCWIMIDSDRKFLRFYSYIQATSPDDAALLELANRCNEKTALIRYAYSREHRRFFGNYEMSYRNGILRPHLLRITREFAGAFNFVLNHEDRDDLLIPPADSDTSTDDAPRMLN
ncbi:hypothetical protein [Parapedomonas caeni]